MRQPKKPRELCPTCGKPGTKWDPLPHDHRPISEKAKPVPMKDVDW